MKRLLTAFILASLASPAWADNVANCEVVILERIEDEGVAVGGAEIASYLPAVDFMASVYDDEPGWVEEMRGQPLRAVLCKRKNIIPTLRDLPIVETGLQFSLSQDFDSSTSGLMTVFLKNGRYEHIYSGPELSEDQQAELDDVLETFNLQAEMKRRDAIDMTHVIE